MTVSEQLRIGILGAARIAPAALIAPARDNDDVVVAAVAAVVDGLHAATGLPWWATISATAFGEWWRREVGRSCTE